MEIAIDDIYEGVFESTGRDDKGVHFSSGQKLNASAARYLSDLGVKPDSAKPSPFEVNVVNWVVDQRGHLKGTAKFFAIKTHDIVNANLEGEVPEPPAGVDFREARVNVSFGGGTGRFIKAAGTAKVIAKLFDNGLSVGHITGLVSVP